MNRPRSRRIKLDRSDTMPQNVTSKSNIASDTMPNDASQRARRGPELGSTCRANYAPGPVRWGSYPNKYENARSTNSFPSRDCQLAMIRSLVCQQDRTRAVLCVTWSGVRRFLGGGCRGPAGRKQIQHMKTPGVRICFRPEAASWR